MDTKLGYIKAQFTKDRERMVFDWEKAACVIKGRGAKDASAGLEDDWEWTGGDILRDGKPIPEEKTYVYLASTWATPQLMVDGDVVSCYKMESDANGWDESTYWPPEAIAILEGRK